MGDLIHTLFIHSFIVKNITTPGWQLTLYPTPQRLIKKALYIFNIDYNAIANIKASSSSYKIFRNARAVVRACARCASHTGGIS